ncbi:hypothetical protein I7X12_05815 [Halosimplex litoreum]|uniref:Uncharacterized protein n=1 Tax=Halosimplex litoreum TaxID=1198301 RepID=A0A7T3G0N6_9EURY|nr:hypothetical protein [Halosimplex litoreum]QPV64141.1 hypothetical protein I7X12_05815 [Halosimplex litoreum]
MSRSVTATLGVLLGVVGLAALAVPSITTPLPTGESFVLIVGLVLLLGAVAQVQRRRHTDLEYAETPDAELAVNLPTPGDDLDRRLGRLQLTRFNEAERHRIRDEIGGVAAETIRRRERGSAEAAQRALDEGTWTDDPFAAAFFTGRVPEAPTTDRLRELFDRESPFKRRAVRAIDALERLLEADDRRAVDDRRETDGQPEADDE